MSVRARVDQLGQISSEAWVVDYTDQHGKRLAKSKDADAKPRSWQWTCDKGPHR